MLRQARLHIDVADLPGDTTESTDYALYDGRVQDPGANSALGTLLGRADVEALLAHWSIAQYLTTSGMALEELNWVQDLHGYETVFAPIGVFTQNGTGQAMIGALHVWYDIKRIPVREWQRLRVGGRLD